MQYNYSRPQASPYSKCARLRAVRSLAASTGVVLLVTSDISTVEASWLIESNSTNDKTVRDMLNIDFVMSLDLFKVLGKETDMDQ